MSSSSSISPSPTPTSPPITRIDSFDSSNTSSLRRNHTISTGSSNRINNPYAESNSYSNRSPNLNSLQQAFIHSGGQGQSIESDSADPHSYLEFDPTSTTKTSTNNSSSRPSPKFPPLRNNSLPNRFSNRRQYFGHPTSILPAILAGLCCFLLPSISVFLLKFLLSNFSYSSPFCNSEPFPSSISPRSFSNQPKYTLQISSLCGI